jgi:hypothetical protein
LGKKYKNEFTIGSPKTFPLRKNKNKAFWLKKKQKVKNKLKSNQKKIGNNYGVTPTVLL